MPDGVYVEWEVVENRFPEVVASVNATSRAAVKSVADRIAATARSLVAVETGLLQSTIHAESLAAGYEAQVVAGDDEAYYAGFVEHGTRFMAAQPFMAPAVKQHAHELPEEIMVAFEI